MTERGKIIAKALKLRELRDRGVDGEQANAKTMFEKYVAKHDIKDSELNDFKYSGSDYEQYVNMSDDEFFNEILRELLPISIGYLLSKLGGYDLQAHAKSQYNQTVNKYIDVILKRVDKKTGKTS